MSRFTFICEDEPMPPCGIKCWSLIKNAIRLLYNFIVLVSKLNVHVCDANDAL